MHFSHQVRLGFTGQQKALIPTKHTWEATPRNKTEKLPQPDRSTSWSEAVSSSHRWTWFLVIVLRELGQTSDIMLLMHCSTSKATTCPCHAGFMPLPERFGLCCSQHGACATAPAHPAPASASGVTARGCDEGAAAAPGATGSLLWCHKWLTRRCCHRVTGEQTGQSREIAQFPRAKLSKSGKEIQDFLAYARRGKKKKNLNQMLQKNKQEIPSLRTGNSFTPYFKNFLQSKFNESRDKTDAKTHYAP